MQKPLSPKVADRVYSILCAYAGAAETDREAFVVKHSERVIGSCAIKSLLGRKHDVQFHRELTASGEKWYLAAYSDSVSEFRAWCLRQGNEYLEQIRVQFEEAEREATM